MSCNILETGKKKAQENMDLDEKLLLSLDNARGPILHLYDWQHDAATYGYFVDPASFLDIGQVQNVGLDLGKRPTGGGIIFHLTDLAFSFLMPVSDKRFSLNPLDNYAFVNERVKQAIYAFIGKSASLLPHEPSNFSAACRVFCMAKPTKYDLMIDGKKIGGAAQRKTRLGYLHQGSISIATLSFDYLKYLLKPKEEVIEGMRVNGDALLGSQWTHSELLSARKELSQQLKAVFSR